MNPFSSFFQKRKLRETTQEFSDALGKHLRYKSDVLPQESYKNLSGFHQELQSALKGKKTEEFQGLLNKGDRLVSKHLPMDSLDWLREQVEVILVAVVTALAIRAYFYQPFKIPTDSMKPTLYGVQSGNVDGPAPSWLQQRYEQLAYGSLYHSLQFKSDCTLVTMEECKINLLKVWFDYTDLTFSNGETHRVWCSPTDLQKQGILPINYYPPTIEPIQYTDKEKAMVKYNVDHNISVQGLPPRKYLAGETVTFRTDAGDQVLVNKWLFNFRLPQRGEVLVFKTTNIAGIEDRLRQEGIEGSEFYIKRCVGLPGDTLRVRPPLLLIDEDTKLENGPMRRVEAAKDGYRGYGFDDNGRSNPPQYLRTPDDSFTVPTNGFWAMGDNSYNSLDSRFWGPVPRENIVGTGTLVWWPFGKRWGIIN